MTEQEWQERGETLILAMHAALALDMRASTEETLTRVINQAEQLIVFFDAMLPHLSGQYQTDMQEMAAQTMEWMVVAAKKLAGLRNSELIAAELASGCAGLVTVH